MTSPMLHTLSLLFCHQTLAGTMQPQSVDVVFGEGVDGVPWSEIGDELFQAPPKKPGTLSDERKGAMYDIRTRAESEEGPPSYVVFQPVDRFADPQRWKLEEPIAGGGWLERHREGVGGVLHRTGHPHLYLYLPGGHTYARGERRGAPSAVELIRILDERDVFEVIPLLLPLEDTEVGVRAALAEGEVWRAVVMLNAGRLGRGDVHARLYGEIQAVAEPLYTDALKQALQADDPVARQGFVSRHLEARDAADVSPRQPPPEVAQVAAALKADAQAFEAEGRWATAWASRILANTLVSDWDRPGWPDGQRERFAPVPEHLVQTRKGWEARGDIRIEVRSETDRLQTDVRQGNQETLTYFDTHVYQNDDAKSAWQAQVEAAELAYWRAVHADCPGGRQQMTKDDDDPGGYDPVATKVRTEQRLDCPPGEACSRVLEEVTTTTWQKTEPIERAPQIAFCSDRQREADRRRAELTWSKPSATTVTRTTREITVTDEIQTWTGTYERVVAVLGPEGEHVVTQTVAPEGIPRLKRMAEGLAYDDRVNEWLSREQLMRRLTGSLDEALWDTVHTLIDARITEHARGLAEPEVEAAWLRHMAWDAAPPETYRFPLW